MLGMYTESEKKTTEQFVQLVVIPKYNFLSETVIRSVGFQFCTHKYSQP